MSFKSWLEDQKKKSAAPGDGKPNMQVIGPAPAVATDKAPSAAVPSKRA
jgi:hypothetical protein